jgi:hypothetical protein
MADAKLIRSRLSRRQSRNAPTTLANMTPINAPPAVMAAATTLGSRSDFDSQSENEKLATTQATPKMKVATAAAILGCDPKNSFTGAKSNTKPPHF